MEILERLTQIIPLQKENDLEYQLKAIQEMFPTVTDFSRNFPSLCFSLATGVGKTRLMGAFIAYLHFEWRVKNFFVIAPGLTIYNKLIQDFTPHTPKYVFEGITELSPHPPRIITGENYEQARQLLSSASLFGDIPQINVNIFNISKITSRDAKDCKLEKDDQQRNVPRFRRLREELGESYFDYLASLDDLVVLMDEAHRYKADAGMEAINELKPVLGLELTATPQVERGNKTYRFPNIVYDYTLAHAMDDGFVKEPAVVTRKNFIANEMPEAELERIKLEDGIRVHEDTKASLEIYGVNSGRPVVKPFLLIIAQNTTHAARLQEYIESPDFFGGRYAGKVISVDSKTTKGVEGDEIVQRLLTVESTDNPIEIVIHVNMLKEGWDVTNLYTIIPLRAANSKTLVEQSIGRGLRLPYGTRTGVPAVDQLKIIAHDRFKEIIDYANDPDSVLHDRLVLIDVPETGKEVVRLKSRFDEALTDADDTGMFPAIESPEERRFTETAWQVMRDLLGEQNAPKDLESPQTQEYLEKKTREKLNLPESLPGIDYQTAMLQRAAKRVVNVHKRWNIEIPRIHIVPGAESHCYYDTFPLNLSNTRPTPPSAELIARSLVDNQTVTIDQDLESLDQAPLESYLVQQLSENPEVNFLENRETVYDLSRQLVAHLRTYIANESDIRLTLQYYQSMFAEVVFKQMESHFHVVCDEYSQTECRGMVVMDTTLSSIPAGEGIRPFRQPIPDGMKSLVRLMAFNGFVKCVFEVQKFDSDPERRFAGILEDDCSVLKWGRPTDNIFRIYYDGTHVYNPDFVVETQTGKYIFEIKAANQMTDPTVLSKARSAEEYCRAATQYDKKPWKYLLISETDVQPNCDLEFYEQKCRNRNENKKG